MEKALEDLVELLKHLSITRDENHFIIEDIGIGVKNRD